jgi:ATP-dependent RNA helicase RhlE
MRFDELNLAPELVRNVAALGYEIPTPIQQQAMPAALEGKDVMGRAPTGTGKTAAFMLPTLTRLRGKEGLRALVLCPTRELAIQVAESAREYAQGTELFVGVVYGGVPLDRETRDLRAGLEVLVATPGRLIDHIERGNVDLSEIEVLVLDEADRMLDMGFKPQIDQILRRVPRVRQTLFFSATMPNSVKSLAYEMLRDPVTVEAAPKVTTAEGVEQFVYPVDHRKKTELLLHLIREHNPESSLVFTRTKFGADRLATQLQRAGLQVEVMHGDRNMAQRVRALEAFREKHVKILIATDVAQRGLDVEGISHVVNYDAPKDPEGYVHRVGRTARAGEKGIAITLMSGGEIGDVAAVEHLLGYRIARVHVPGYSFMGEGEEPTMEMPQTQREERALRGRRLGKRAGKELTPEELEKLLKVG